MEDKRTEYLTMYVTPEVKKEFEKTKDNKALQEQIIRDFVKSEKNWLEEEMKEVDEATIRYKSKLLSIRDNFSVAQDEIADEIALLYDKVSSEKRKIEDIVDKVAKSSRQIKDDLIWINEFCDKFNTYNIERYMEIIERFKRLSNDEKEVLNLILRK